MPTRAKVTLRAREVRTRPVDTPTIRKAFEAMSRHLKDEGAIVEICVYGGSAIMFLFDWRKATKDVDVVVREGDHVKLRRARDKAARELGLPDSWLNDAVAQYVSAVEADADRVEVGLYPSASYPALRVMAASPRYLFAMKVVAASDRKAPRDFSDASALGMEIGLATEGDVLDAVRRFFPDFTAPSEGDVVGDVVAGMSRSGRAP